MPKFLSRTRDKEVKIAPSFIVFDYKAYDTFDRFLSEVLPVIVEFGRVYKEVSFSRVGFRFINRFDFDVQPSKMDWSTYFQSDLVSVEKFIPNAEAVSRLLHLVEFNYEDGLLRFQFGQSNPDYPAPIRRCQFLLDLDAYANGPFDAGDVEPLLEGFHKRIQHLFESSITDALRDKMNGS